MINHRWALNENHVLFVSFAMSFFMFFFWMELGHLFHLFFASIFSMFVFRLCVWLTSTQIKICVRSSTSALHSRVYVFVRRHSFISRFQLEFSCTLFYFGFSKRMSEVEMPKPMAWSPMTWEKVWCPYIRTPVCYVGQVWNKVWMSNVRVMRMKYGLMYHWRWLMKHNRRLTVYHRGSVHHNGWLMKHYRGSMNYNIRPVQNNIGLMVYFWRWVVNKWWAMHYHQILFVSFHRNFVITSMLFSS